MRRFGAESGELLSGVKELEAPEQQGLGLPLQRLEPSKRHQKGYTLAGELHSSWCGLDSSKAGSKDFERCSLMGALHEESPTRRVRVEL